MLVLRVCSQPAILGRPRLLMTGAAVVCATLHAVCCNTIVPFGSNSGIYNMAGLLHGETQHAFPV